MAIQSCINKGMSKKNKQNKKKKRRMNYCTSGQLTKTAKARWCSNHQVLYLLYSPPAQVEPLRSQPWHFGHQDITDIRVIHAKMDKSWTARWLVYYFLYTCVVNILQVLIHDFSHHRTGHSRHAVHASNRILPPFHPVSAQCPWALIH